MQLGLLTAPFEDTPLIDVARWAAANGYSQLEVASWPSTSGDRRRYAGTAHLPIEDMTTDRAQQITGELAEVGVSISGLAYYPNNLDPDDA
ncbi:MAG: sugar phosphate isomerase/epimerase, partial [Propionibacterium sp.]|nr:sugar phosphate isomerase/epimerase [Propionibacterium sp.]